MRYKEFVESTNMFATRPGARIADYINQLADHSDFLDPEEIPVVKTVARAFRRDIQSGLQAFEAMDPTVNDHIYGMVAKNLGIDLYDEAEKIGIDLAESDDLFAQSRQRTAQKPVKPPQPKLSAPIIDQKIMGYIPANSVTFDGIDWKDPGDLANVYVDAATFADGTPLNDAQRERLTNELERTGQLLEIVGEMWHDWAENWGQV